MSAPDFGRALKAGLLGLVVGPVVVFAVMLVFYLSDPRCGTPGDSGGCEMGVASATMVAPIPGALLFFFVSLAKGLFGHRRREELA